MDDFQTLNLGKYQSAADRVPERWKAANVVGRMWSHDPTVWADADTPEIANRLDWLQIPLHAAPPVLPARPGQVVVLGMGGSSLAPEVFGQVFDAPITVVDSTHPDVVRSVEIANDTMFVVSSKSGTTLETLSLFRHFWELTRHDGDRFVAVTDPRTPLAELALERKFSAVYTANPRVGGRYSAFTHFGLVPASLAGIDLDALLDATHESARAVAGGMVHDSAVQLGAAIGVLATAGRDKLTFVVPERYASFPMWLEQLIAESTGKDGSGIVPVAGEPLADDLSVYGDDRAFIVYHEGSPPDLGELPVIAIEISEATDIAREMYRWMVAVPLASEILGVHPFDQPNVEAAKRLAREAMEGDGGEAEIEVLSPDAALDAVRQALSPGGYLGIQAFTPESAELERWADEVRRDFRDRGFATTFGYGPRFLHSTGQLHKGGPDLGAFLQIVDDPAADLDVPETGYTFGEVIAAQADGDYRALQEAGRTVVRVRREDLLGA